MRLAGYPTQPSTSHGTQVYMVHMGPCTRVLHHLATCTYAQGGSAPGELYVLFPIGDHVLDVCPRTAHLMIPALADSKCDKLLCADHEVRIIADGHLVAIS